MITFPTCFQNPENPTSIDVILTNIDKRFYDSQEIETGLSNFHKLTITALKAFIQKKEPIIIDYRDNKKFDGKYLKLNLNHNLESFGKRIMSFDDFAPF